MLRSITLYTAEGLELDIEQYVGVDGTPVIHINTPDIDENETGPVLRVYLNDDPIFENPPFPEPDQEE